MATQRPKAVSLLDHHASDRIDATPTGCVEAGIFSEAPHQTEHADYFSTWTVPADGLHRNL